MSTNIGPMRAKLCQKLANIGRNSRTWAKHLQRACFENYSGIVPSSVPRPVRREAIWLAILRICAVRQHLFSIFGELSEKWVGPTQYWATLRVSPRSPPDKGVLPLPKGASLHRSNGPDANLVDTCARVQCARALFEMRMQSAKTSQATLWETREP